MDLSNTLNEIDKQLDNDNFTTHKYVVYSIISNFIGILIIIIVIAIIYSDKKGTIKKNNP